MFSIVVVSPYFFGLSKDKRWNNSYTKFYKQSKDKIKKLIISQIYEMTITLNQLFSIDMMIKKYNI